MRKCDVIISPIVPDEEKNQGLNYQTQDEIQISGEENLNFYKEGKYKIIYDGLKEFFARCPDIYESQNFMKLLVSSNILKNFVIRKTDSTFFIYFELKTFIQKVEISGDAFPDDLIDDLKASFLGKEFSSQADIENLCLLILSENYVLNPKCEVFFEGDVLKLDISGEVKSISRISVNIYAESQVDVWREEAEEIRKVISEFVSKWEFFSRSKAEQFKDFIADELSKRGYLEAKIKVEFKSGELKADIKLGRKVIFFIYVEEEKKTGIDLLKLKRDLEKESFGRFNDMFIKNFTRDWFESRGIPINSVETKFVEMVDENLVIVNVKVVPAKTYYLVKFSVHGLSTISESDLKRNIGIKTKGFFTLFNIRHGLYTERSIDELILQIVNYAKLKGYDDFKIRKVEKKIEGDNISVDVFASEGERRVIGEFLFIGFPEDVSDLVPSPPIFYDKILISNIKRELERYLSEKGYMNFKISVKEEFATPKVKKVFFIFSGERKKAVLGFAFINSKTDKNFLKKIAGIKEGMEISSSRIGNMADSLRRTLYFDDVNAETMILKDDEKYTVYAVALNTKEGKLSDFEVSGGLSSVEGVRGGVKYERRNILYNGIDAQIQVRSAYWIFPFGREIGLTFLGASLKIERRKITEHFDTALIISPYFQSTFLYSINKPILVSLPFSGLFMKNRLNFRTTFSFERRNLLSWQFDINPEIGGLSNVVVVSPSLSFMSFGLFERFLDIDRAKFVWEDEKFEIKDPSSWRETFFSGVNAQFIYPAGNPLSLKLEGGLEYYNIKHLLGLGLSISVGRIFLKDIFYVPLERRFFLGGVDGPRGYQELSIYPEILYSGKFQESSPEIRYKPQNKLVLMSEFFLPEIFFLRPYVFFDVGDVFHDGQSLSLKKGVGPGLFIITPIGPIRFELGYGIDRKSFIIHFRVGLRKIVM